MILDIFDVVVILFNRKTDKNVRHRFLGLLKQILKNQKVFDQQISREHRANVGKIQPTGCQWSEV